MPRTHYRSCHLCEAMCGIAIEVEGEKILSIKGDADDPFSKGYVCPKALALEDVHEDKDRLRRPLRRTSSGFEEIGWEDALDEAARGLARVQEAHGRDAVALYFGNPTVHNYGALLYGLLFAETLRTRNRFSATSCDQLPRMVAAYLMYGHQLLMAVPDIDRTDFLLVLGANPLASNGSIMTAPGIGKRLAAIRARGGRVVLLDPRRTESASVASEHHFIRPGTDALFLLSLLNVIFEEKLENPGKLAFFTDGLGEAREIARRFPPDRVARATGIAKETIVEIARAFARSNRAVCYGRIGTSTQEFGSLASWLVEVVNIATGNLDREGGAMFALPAADVVTGATRLGQKGSFGRYRSRVRGLPEFGGELPSACLAEEIDQEGEGRIRALLTAAGNPVLSTPNGQRLERALPRLDFMVSVDFYLNETTRHAHLVLPPTFALEHDQYDLGLHLVAVRNTAKLSPALFERGEDQRHDWEIFLELATRLLRLRGPGARAAAPLVEKVACCLEPRGILDFMLRSGPHGDFWNPFSRGLSAKKLLESPHGVDLGPLTPCLPGRLGTKDRRIRLVPDEMRADLARLEERLARELERPAPLRLIGRRHLKSNNSWMHNSPRLVSGKDRCTLLMHPDDARERGLSPDERVRVSSRSGEVVAPLEITDSVMPGVVSLPHGWGHTRPGVRLGVASEHAGVSANDLTDELVVDAVSGTASLSGVPVTVEALVPAPRAPAPSVG